MTLSNSNMTMQSSDFMKFVWPVLICLAVAAVCALIFGSAMHSSYPQGVKLFEPEANLAPQPSNAFYIGMAIGSFFCALVYAAMFVSAFLLQRFHSSPLQHLIKPLLTASLCCGACSVLSLMLAH